MEKGITFDKALTIVQVTAPLAAATVAIMVAYSVTASKVQALEIRMDQGSSRHEKVADDVIKLREDMARALALLERIERSAK